MKVELRRSRDIPDPCHLMRLGHPAAILAARGYDVTEVAGGIDMLLYDLEWMKDGKPIGRKVRTVTAGFDTEADVLVFGRLMDQQTVEAIPAMQRAGHAVVIEIDDDFHALPKGHPARRATASSVNPTNNRRWLRLACEQADLVTVSTPALAERYGAHGRCRILRNLIPASYLTVDPYRDGQTMGWTGHTGNHVTDLQAAGNGVRKALDGTLWRFRHIGPLDDTQHELGLTDMVMSTSGIVPLADYPSAYAQLDVAIAPLRLNPFNEAKSWLKPLEAAALGVPCVASPTEEYVAAAVRGLCVIAETPGQWTFYLRSLMREDCRTTLRESGREAASRLTYEEHAEDWWDAWEQAVINHRARRSR